MKFYMLTVLIKLKKPGAEMEAAQEILAQLQTDGQETILCQRRECSGHEVVKKADMALFPNCLTANTDRVAIEISLPTQKDLGRRWFLKRLEGKEKKTFLLIAMTDVSVIHVENQL